VPSTVHSGRNSDGSSATVDDPVNQYTALGPTALGPTVVSATAGADAGLGVVAIDLPGQYESPGPPDETCYLPAALGPVLAGVVRRLDPQPVILLGHSYGGLVCRAAVLAGARVAGLALLCSGPAALPDGVRRTLLDFAEPILRASGVHAVHRLREAADASASLAPPIHAKIRMPASPGGSDV